MPRQLRKNGTKNYSAQNDESERPQNVIAGPYRQRISNEDIGSGSDFAPNDAESSGPEFALEVEDEMDADDFNYEDLASGSTKGRKKSVLSSTHVTSVKAKGKRKEASSKGGAVNMTKNSSIQIAPGLVRPSNRQMYVLPTPSVHHRHRAVPLFSRLGRVERLDSPPQLFGPCSTTMTNDFTDSPAITDRVSKAWGYNVGSGPLWELMEDRGFFKQGVVNGEQDADIGDSRPRVYENVVVVEGWSILALNEAAVYLPKEPDTIIAGAPSPTSPIICHFGPFGAQRRVEMKIFDSLRMSDFVPESKAHVFHAGAPVWGLDWLPVHKDEQSQRSYTQYLAVAPYPSQSYSPVIGRRIPRPSFACIQIWSLVPSRPIAQSRMAEDSSPEQDLGKMRCAMVICHDRGPAHEIKWCPLPSHERLSDPKSLSATRKIGLLAGVFEDGSLSIFAIPDPLDVTAANHNVVSPVFVKLPEPILCLELEETACWTLDWANSDVIAVGCTNGAIAIYNIADALVAGTGSKTLPTHYISVHQSAVRALAWIRAPPSSPDGTPCTDEDPTVIASGGYDGVECLTDIREGHGCAMNRTRDVISAMTFSAYAGGPITIDHENIVKAYSASPSMLGRGHMLMEPGGPVWSVHASDYHPQLAVASSDGSCLTTNILRSTRRGGTVPFFVHKIYQLDYSRKAKEWRMVDRFLPQETQPAALNSSKKADKASGKMHTIGTGVWPPEVGIHRVVWNSGNGLSAARLLASATAAGICRVDLLDGRWMKGKIPYGSVANIRKEDAGSEMYVDGLESESDG